MRPWSFLLLALAPFIMNQARAQEQGQEPPMVMLTTNGGYYPTWSPDGTQIAFDVGPWGPIWTMPAAGGEAELLYNGEATSLAWSPDGDRIAFSAAHCGQWECEEDILVFRLSDGQVHDLTRKGYLYLASEWSPAWSPDGTKIAFNRVDPWSPGEPSAIFVMESTGEPPYASQLTFFDQDWAPAWSPDGERIAFASDGPGNSNFDIWMIFVDGGLPIQLTDTPNTTETEPAWSPDGTQIAFATNSGNGWDIAVMPGEGGDARLLTNRVAYDDFDPVWSPDGTKIAFRSDRSGSSQIWVMDLSTLAVDPAGQVPTHGRLAVSPNPFRQTTTIRLADGQGPATLRIVDVAGRLVRELMAPATSAGGAQTLVWDGRDSRGIPVARGTYYLTQVGGSRWESGRVTRVR